MKIFLDDARLPEQIGWSDSIEEGIEIVRTYEDFIECVTRNRLRIIAISFDHDLGTLKTGYDCITWLESQIYFGNVRCPKYLGCHSMNSPGAERIRLVIKSIRGRQK